jgi:uncharacterized protein (DUF433 family)
MADLVPPYVERRDDAYTISGTRVSLDSIVYGFLSGQSAESIAQSFPVLTLDQIYGAIAYYLAHRDEIDRYVEARRRDFDPNASRRAPPIRCSTRSSPTPRSRRRSLADADPLFRRSLSQSDRRLCGREALPGDRTSERQARARWS